MSSDEPTAADRVRAELLDDARHQDERDVRAVQLAHAVDAVIRAHPLLNRYGFDRNDLIAQLRQQARLSKEEAALSQRRGMGKMLMHQETVTWLANLALAALTDAEHGR